MICWLIRQYVVNHDSQSWGLSFSAEPALMCRPSFDGKDSYELVAIFKDVT